jgi:hypothetical protein
LNHSGNNEQAAQATAGGGPIGRNDQENEEMNNILMGLEAAFICCLDLMSRKHPKDRTMASNKKTMNNNGAGNQGTNQQAGNQPTVLLSPLPHLLSMSCGKNMSLESGLVCSPLSRGGESSALVVEGKHHGDTIGFQVQAGQVAD